MDMPFGARSLQMPLGFGARLLFLFVAQVHSTADCDVCCRDAFLNAGPSAYCGDGCWNCACDPASGASEMCGCIHDCQYNVEDVENLPPSAPPLSIELATLPQNTNLLILLNSVPLGILLLFRLPALLLRWISRARKRRYFRDPGDQQPWRVQTATAKHVIHQVGDGGPPDHNQTDSYQVTCEWIVHGNGGNDVHISWTWTSEEAYDAACAARARSTRAEAQEFHVDVAFVLRGDKVEDAELRDLLFRHPTAPVHPICGTSGVLDVSLNLITVAVGAVLSAGVIFALMERAFYCTHIHDTGCSLSILISAGVILVVPASLMLYSFLRHDTYTAGNVWLVRDNWSVPADALVRRLEPTTMSPSANNQTNVDATEVDCWTLLLLPCVASVILGMVMLFITLAWLSQNLPLCDDERCILDRCIHERDLIQDDRIA